MNKYFIVYIFLLFSFTSNGQEIKSYVINIENSKAYLDITSAKAKVGDVLSICLLYTSPSPRDTR